jgi:hypothetical protein
MSAYAYQEGRFVSSGHFPRQHDNVVDRSGFMHAYVTGRIDTRVATPKCLEHPGDGLFHIRRCDRGRRALRCHDEMDDLSAPRRRVEPLRPIGIVPCSNIAGWNPICNPNLRQEPTKYPRRVSVINTCDFPRLSVPVTTLRTIGLGLGAD